MRGTARLTRIISSAPLFRVLSVSGILAVNLACPAGSECTKPVLFGSPIPFATGPNAQYVTAGDFNEDGVVDLAVTNGDYFNDGANSSIAILIGTGNRAFATPVLYESGRAPYRIVTRDFNEDGILDLAAANKFSNTISVLIGNGTGGVGNGTFAPTVHYPAGSGPFGLVAEDFDGDGIIDLATCLNFTPAVSVLRGNGSGGVGNGTFGSPTTFPLNNVSTGLASGDFNGDNIVDLVATENYDGTVGVLLGTGIATLGPGSFSAAIHYVAGVGPFHVEVADFNEDGDQDLVVPNTGYGGTVVMLGTGTGSFVSQTTLPSGNTGTAAIGDANQDGIPDLIVGTTTGNNLGMVRVYLGRGVGGVGNGSFEPPTDYSSGADAYQIIAGDFDHDGLLDLVVAAGYDNFVALLPGTCSDAPPDSRLPVLTDVRDVPSDQGGRVFLTWTATSLDQPGGAVNSYRVWRRIHPAQATAALQARIEQRDVIAIPQPDSPNDLVYWEAIVTLPAQRLEGYGYTAATTQDSMNNNPYTAFFITALTSNIDVFYSSNVDSGYSVDNIRPRRPSGLVGQSVASGFALHWDPNDDPDLAGYRLYRGATEDFPTSETNLIATPNDTGHVDPQGHGDSFYKLSAIDAHGNESDVLLLAPNVPTGLGDPSGPMLALHGARPNPSVDGRLRIHFALPSNVVARLEVIDLAGRKVAARVLEGLGPGDHVMTLSEEKRLPAGVYVVRLMQGTESRQLKIVMAQ